MLLKVEVYPFTGEPHTGTRREPPEAPLYVSLGTATGDEGLLLTVGRKTGDVLLPADRSASREHCRIRLVTTNKTLPVLAHCPARNADEQQACQESSFYQCAAVLEGAGKMGTYILEPVLAEGDPSQKQHKHDDDTDSGTDDEDDLVISQAVGAPSQASQGLLPPSLWIRTLVLGEEGAASSGQRSIRRQVLGADENVILKQLSEYDGRVVIQCGRQESVLVLTRVPIYVQRTKSALGRTSSLPPWWVQLVAAGIVDVTDQPIPDQTTVLLYPRTTHLVASTRAPTHKQLCAWLRDIPIVTADYCQALLARKSPREALPTPTVPAAKESFWETSPTPTLWRGLTYLSTHKGDEWPEIVQALGGNVIRVNIEGGDDWEEVLVGFDRASAWSVDARSKKVTQQLRDAQIRVFTGKEVARAVTELSILTGLTPMLTTNELPSASINPSWETQSTKTRLAVDDTRASTPEASQPPATTKASGVSRSDMDSKQASLPQTSDSESNPQRQDEDRTPFSVARSSRSRGSKVAPDVEPDGNAPSTSSKGKSPSKSQTTKGSRASARAKESSFKKTPADQSAPVDDSVEMPPVDDQDNDESKGENSESEDKDTSTKKATEAKQTREPAKERSGKRTKLNPNMHGWLQAAPADPKQRGAMKRSKEEILEVYQGENLYVKPAETMWAPKASPLPSAGNGGPTALVRPGRHTGPDFKGFRKNRVPPVYIAHQLCKVYDPKPTVHQAQFEEERRAADEQFQRASELFKDVTRSTASSRRRKLQ
jgi:hypothetical protein